MGGSSGSGHEGRRLRTHPPGVRDDTDSTQPLPAADERPGGARTGSHDGRHETAIDRGVRVLVVATGLAAWAVAGLVVLLSITIEPRDGLAGGASVFKAADVAGWLAIGLLVLRDAWAGRRRTLVLGGAACAWVLVLSWLVGQTGPLPGTLPA